jgi:hypothetical protein
MLLLASFSSCCCRILLLLLLLLLSCQQLSKCGHIIMRLLQLMAFLAAVGGACQVGSSSTRLLCAAACLLVSPSRWHCCCQCHLLVGWCLYSCLPRPQLLQACQDIAGRSRQLAGCSCC